MSVGKSVSWLDSRYHPGTALTWDSMNTKLGSILFCLLLLQHHPQLQLRMDIFLFLSLLLPPQAKPPSPLM